MTDREPCGRVDAHCHLWTLAHGDYGWLDAADPAMAPIARDFGPADLASRLGAAGVDAAVLVQAAPSDAETARMLAMAGRTPAIGAVVGWTDLAAEGAEARIEALAERPGLKGVRPMLQDLPDDWILEAPRPGALRTLEASGLRLDGLVRPAQASALATFAERHPGLPLVVDHAGKPPLAAAPGDPALASWSSAMARLAAAGARCKLSGLLTEMAPRQRATPEGALAVLRPLLDRLLEWFGPDRLLWGSDWPVLRLAGSYAGWDALTDALLAPLTARERAAILGGNARAFYGMGPAGAPA